MRDVSPALHDPKVLILAPAGRDAGIAEAMLRDGGLTSHAVACADLGGFMAELDETACLAVATEEALRGADLRRLAQFVTGQPPWSDLPFIILTARGGGPERNPGAARLSEVLGNVSFMERPFHPTSFISLARTALRGRARQYEARARMEALHEGEERVRLAMAAGRLGAWDLDIATGVLTCSAACKAVFGHAHDAVFDYASLLSCVHPEDRPRMQAAVQLTVDTGTDYAIEYRTIWPDGGVHWAEIRARLLHDRAGNAARLVGVSSDVTERKTAEADLRHVNQSLEQRVLERTDELRQAHAHVLAEIAQREATEEQLRQAQKVEAMGRITGGVAHDFNNLLLVVLANLDLLRERVATDAAAQPLVEGAIQAAQRGAALTQRLLAFARRQELTLAPAGLEPLVRDMLDLLRQSLRPGVELSLELEEGLPAAMVDANQVELALLNLVVNARDAMPNGGRLTIALDLVRPPHGDELPAGDYLRLSVADTGQGMDQDTLRRAVDPFFSTKEPGKGTGLGLSMVDGLARQLRGELRLSSRLGQGTRAELWLPASEAVALSPVAAPPPKADPRPAQPLTILFVEDEAIIAMATRAMLVNLGHRVIDVRSGPKALQVIQSGEALDLLITDFSMPSMTGLQLATLVRELRPALPILLATGYMTMPEGATLDLPRLSKPYMQRELRDKIESVMAQAG